MNLPLFYAGIGARVAPQDVLFDMQAIARRLRKLGYILRSGGAVGADSAFAIGADKDSVIFPPSAATQESMYLARRFHPAWHRCANDVRHKHGRNVMILLGRELNDPVEFVVCWTRAGRLVGGTGFGLRVAKAYDIKVYNLGTTRDRESLKKFLHERASSPKILNDVGNSSIQRQIRKRVA